jgi:hypothetical protein
MKTKPARIAACRAITGTVKTSPALSVCHEAGFYELPLLLKLAASRMKVKVKSTFPDQTALVPALGNEPYDVHDPDTSNIHFHLPADNATAPGSADTPEGRAMRVTLNTLRLSASNVPPASTLTLATDGTSGDEPAAAAVLSRVRDAYHHPVADATAYPARGAVRRHCRPPPAHLPPRDARP